MEIPTEEIIEQLEILLPQHRRDAIQLINAQALEIRELQKVIVKLREEKQQMHVNESKAIEILVYGDNPAT